MSERTPFFLEQLHKRFIEEELRRCVKDGILFPTQGDVAAHMNRELELDDDSIRASHITKLIREWNESEGVLATKQSRKPKYLKWPIEPKADKSELNGSIVANILKRLDRIERKLELPLFKDEDGE